MTPLKALWRKIINAYHIYKAIRDKRYILFARVFRGRFLFKKHFTCLFKATVINKLSLSPKVSGIHNNNG